MNEHAHGKSAWTMPTAYLGASTTAPDASDGNVTEPVGNAYARITTSAADWGSSTAGTITNAQVLSYPTATGSWGTVTHVVAHDAPTGGNLLWSASITPQSVNAGGTLSIPIGDADSSIN